MRQPLVIAHHSGRSFLLDRSAEHRYSSFGGPCEVQVEGAPLPRPLHLIAVLSAAELPFLGAPSYIFDLPLLYGMRYDDGGTVRYEFNREAVTIVPPLPSAGADDWPYRGFPDILPYYTLEVIEVVEESWESFAQRAPNLPAEQSAPLVVIVPPPQGLGFTLWGRSGDAEGVTVVFECDLEAKRVLAYNVCS